MLAAAIAMLALPGPASAEYLVPPDNSAATQYTESLPTAGGHRDAESGKGGGNGDGRNSRSRSEALGAENARRLEAQGQAGRETAEFAAETAPQGATDGTAAGPRHNGNGGQSGGAGHPSANGNGGSSGVGQVVKQATGSSSTGRLGALLPLVIVGAIAWALAFLWWRRKSPTA